MDRKDAKITLRSVVLDCRNPAELSKFYADLLDGRQAIDDPGWANVVLEGAGVRLSFQRDEDYQRPVWPGGPGDQQQMVHLDFLVEDQKASAEKALSLGAVLAETQYCDPKNMTDVWTTLLDPEGHPFCLCGGK